MHHEHSSFYDNNVVFVFFIMQVDVYKDDVTIYSTVCLFFFFLTNYGISFAVFC